MTNKLPVIIFVCGDDPKPTTDQVQAALNEVTEGLAPDLEGITIEYVQISTPGDWLNLWPANAEKYTKALCLATYTWITWPQTLNSRTADGLIDPTPPEFIGVFYSSDSGSGEIFAFGGRFADHVHSAEHGLFLAMGAWFDLTINGYTDLADEILAPVRVLWPEEIKTNPAFEKLLAVCEQKPAGWREVAIDYVKDLMPEHYKRPADFTGYLLETETYDEVFALREAYVSVMAEMNNLAAVVKAICDCELNTPDHDDPSAPGEPIGPVHPAVRLAADLEDAIPHFFPGANWEKIGQARDLAKKLKAKPDPDWPTKLGFTLDLMFNGVALMSL